MAIDAADVKELVVGLLNGQPEQEGFEIYGMSISDVSIDAAIELSRRNLIALVGTTVYNDATKEDAVSSCLIDMSCHRVVLNMMGVSIGTHFYYKTTDLTISKNVQPALQAQEEAFRLSIRYWLKILIGKNWTNVGVLDDLAIVNPVYDPVLGKSLITKDTDLYNNFLN